MVTFLILIISSLTGIQNKGIEMDKPAFCKEARRLNFTKYLPLVQVDKILIKNSLCFLRIS